MNLFTQQHIFLGLLKIGAALSALALCLFLWSSYIEQPYLRYQNLPFPTVIEQVRPGDAIPMIVERCNTSKESQSYSTSLAFRNEKTKVSEKLIDTQVVIEKGCHRDLNLAYSVPLDTKPGFYRISGVAVIEGAFIKHYVEWYSEPFEVVAVPLVAPTPVVADEDVKWII